MHSRQTRSRDNIPPLASSYYLHSDKSASIDQNINEFLQGPSSKILMSSQSPSTIKALRKIRVQAESPAAAFDFNHKGAVPYSVLKKKPVEEPEAFESYSVSSHQERKPGTTMESGATTRLRLHLKEKEKEIDSLQARIQELNKELHNKNMLNKSYAAMNFDVQNSINMTEIEKEDPQKQKQILSALILQTFDTFKNLKGRCNSLITLVEILEHGMIGSISDYEFSKMKKTIEDLAKTLVDSSKTEIELGLKNRENEKKNLDMVKLNVQFNNLKDQHKHLQEQYNDLKKRKQDVEDRMQQMEKQFDGEKAKNSKNEKQIEMLEKRIELILDTDITVDKDKLRKALTELVKENESLKRETITKNKEIKKLKDDVGKVQTKIARQGRKIETLLRNKKGAGSTILKEGEKDPFSEDKIFKDDDLNLLQQNTIPLTLDFRTSSLKIQFSDLLNDIMDQGSNVFVSQMNTLDNIRDKKEAIIFVTNQLINFREFSDKLHFFLKEAFELLKLEDIKEVQAFLSKYFRHIFNSQILNLWVPDGITGILYTTDPTGKEVRCLGTKGLISDVLKNGKPYNKRHMKNSYICELTSATGKLQVDNTLLIPIKRPNGRVIGALEVSNIADSHFGFDEEYFGVALGQLVLNVIHRINFQNTLIQENRLKDILIQSFIQLTACKTRYALSAAIKEYASKVFGVSTANFLFVENEKFVIYTSETNRKEYDVNIGLSGHVHKSQRGLIITDVASSKEYNSLVDMVSIMPIYFSPVLLKNDSTGEPEVVGVLQLLIKPKGGRAEERIENVDEMLAHIGLDEPTENLVNRYCGLVANSIMIFKERSKNL